ISGPSSPSPRRIHQLGRHLKGPPHLFVRGRWVRLLSEMSAKKPRRETRADGPVAKAAVPLCRYEELALRENRLRQAAAKREPDD
ncbi:MAG: hypothetical protein KJ876_01805, partial [Alphaproteobacteria bacterium]|nr:hypothetical protein [Alphaproteobacteria bacterium]